MKHLRNAVWMVILAAPLVWIGTGNAETPTPTTAPAASTTSSSSTSSTTTSTSTTTIPPTTIPAGDWNCPEWIPYLLFVGFPETELPTADRILWRESNCNPQAVNRDDPNGGSHGGFQINGIWLDWFLPDMGIAWSAQDLYDPVINAAAAFAIWERSNGWHPWSTY